MRIHSLLIAGALAGLMANGTPARALEVNAPAHHTMKPTSHHHKHVAKHGGSEKHLAITKDGTRTAGGTVSKQLMGKSNRSAKENGVSARRFSKHHFKSSNASIKHRKSGHSMKSTSKNYQ